MMYLSQHFTLGEMVRSSTAKRHNIANDPNQKQIDNLAVLCIELLEPIRKKVGHPLIINSGFRSLELNAMVKGSPSSYHLQGKAADISAESESDAETIASAAVECKRCDKAIIETNGRSWWVHVQWSFTPRRKKLKIDLSRK